MIQVPSGYTVVRELGHGRLGPTSLCRTAGGDEVVVTALGVRPASERARGELTSELQAAAAAFKHPCAVAVRLVGDDALWLIQPYLAGGALGSAALGPDAVTIGGVRLTTALASGHAAGMLHGDVRPSKVLRNADGAWLLAAGGVAHAVDRASSDAGSQPDPLFAAPELFSGEQPGAAADVYSLGATLYAALTGQAPHAEAARDGVGALHAARLRPPPELPLSVPASLAALIARMLAADPAERPALSEVDQVLRSLAPAGSSLPPPVPSRVVPPPPRPAVRLAVTEPAAVAAASKRRTLVAAIAIGAVFLASAGALAATSGEDETQLAAAVGGTPTATPATAPTPAPAAVSTPKPARSPEPGATPSPAAPRGKVIDLTPTIVKVAPVVFEGRLVLLVTYHMDLVTQSVDSWVVTAYSARDGEVLDQDQFPPTARQPGDYGFYADPVKVPLDSCFKVTTIENGRSYTSRKKCSNPEEVRVAQRDFQKAKRTPVPSPGRTT